MADAIHLCAVTQDGESWERQVSYVNLPTEFGSFGILKNHAPMLCALAKGTVKYRYDGDAVGYLRISDGIANIADNEITLLLSYLEDVKT